MGGTKELRQRIKSIKNTAKVTKAMELVSAAKMRRAQDQALKGRNYSVLINEVLSNIGSGIKKDAHPLLIRETAEKQAILLVTTNRGLCGSLNTNLFRKIFDIQGQPVYVTIGKKGSSFISKSDNALAADFELLEKPTIAFSRIISKFLINGYLNSEFDKVQVVFTDFQSTLKQIATIKQLLPIINLKTLTTIIEQQKTDSEYKFEPDADSVLETILPHYIEMEIYQILLEASASEHSARMVSMKNASDNASELVDDLTLAYNQVRQANITNEILDISTASIVLN